MVSSLGFLSGPYIPNWLLDKAAIQKTPTGADKNKSLLSLTKGPGNGQPGKIENYLTNTALL